MAWTLTTIEVITGALQLCQAIGVGETVSDADADLCLDSLQGVLKELPIHGYQRPKLSSTPVAVAWVLGTPSSVASPADFIGAPVLKYTAPGGVKRELTRVAKADWETRDLTQTAQYPQIFYVAPDLTFKLWPAPTQDPVLTLTYQSIIPDTTLTATPGLEQQYLNTLQYLLADEVSLKYGVSAQDRAEIAARAAQKKFMVLQWATDQAPIDISVVD
jgi:hypothetical protein